MTISSEADMAQGLADKLAVLDPDGFGALSSGDQTSLKEKLFTAIAQVIREELLTNMSISVSSNGTTSSGCSAGGASGTCSTSGSGSVS